MAIRVRRAENSWLWHGVPHGTGPRAKSLCGFAPKKNWSMSFGKTQVITCPRCLAAIAKATAA